MKPRLLADYLDDRELARELNICKRTLERWRRLGEAPKSAIIGRRRLTHRDTVVTWLQSRES